LGCERSERSIGARPHPSWRSRSKLAAAIGAASAWPESIATWNAWAAAARSPAPCAATPNRPPPTVRPRPPDPPPFPGHPRRLRPRPAGLDRQRRHHPRALVSRCPLRYFRQHPWWSPARWPEPPASEQPTTLTADQWLMQHLITRWEQFVGDGHELAQGFVGRDLRLAPCDLALIVRSATGRAYCLSQRGAV
jgi:hypothetical protein